MIVLGRIVAPFGVRGWLKIRPFGDDPEAWRSMPQWWLCSDDKAAFELWQPHALESVKLHGDGVVAKLVGVDDRNGSEALDGLFIGAPREALPRTGNEEYYWADLIGLEVMNLQEQRLGKVKSLIETGANEVLVLEDGDQQRLVPFVAHVIKAVDVPNGTIRADWGSDW
jgi:16S rRNA processing protein RimM